MKVVYNAILGGWYIVRFLTDSLEKVKIKYVLVNTPTGRYNVPANMLEAV